MLLGPSGCGKSTALRMIAGLEDPTEGTITIGDRVVNDVEPKDRDIAMVFQSYALYPHMTVRRNIEFPLRVAQGRRRPSATQLVRDAAESLGLDELLDRKPAQLSGGQRQRVALARAIVRRPAGVPDGRAAVEPRRQAAGADPRRARRAAAPARGDGRLRHPRPGRGDDDGPSHRDHRTTACSSRSAPPQDVYAQPGEPVRRPVHRHPADEHRRRARSVATARRLGRELPGEPHPARPPRSRRRSTAPGSSEVVVGVRPEHLRLGDRRACSRPPSRVVESLGHERHVVCRLDDGQLVIVRQARDEPAPTDGEHALRLVADPSTLHLFDADDRARGSSA